MLSKVVRLSKDGQFHGSEKYFARRTVNVTVTNYGSFFVFAGKSRDVELPSSSGNNLVIDCKFISSSDIRHARLVYRRNVNHNGRRIFLMCNKRQGLRVIRSDANMISRARVRIVNIASRYSLGWDS